MQIGLVNKLLKQGDNIQHTTLCTSTTLLHFEPLLLYSNSDCKGTFHMQVLTFSWVMLRALTYNCAHTEVGLYKCTVM